MRISQETPAIKWQRGVGIRSLTAVSLLGLLCAVQWFYVDGGGTQAGPVSLAELKQAWASKQLTDGSLVWHASMSGWQSVDSTPELKRLLPSTASPQPTAAVAPATAPRPAMMYGGMGGGQLGASIAQAAAGLKKGHPRTALQSSSSTGRTSITRFIPVIC
jgi:hypothetical protein